MALSEEDKNIIRNRYRFQGYQLPKIQLDETGPSYYDVSPHPYFYNQPRYWQQAVFQGSPYGGMDTDNPDIPTTADTSPIVNNANSDTSERALSEEPLVTSTPKQIEQPEQPEQPEQLPKNKSGSLYNLLPPIK